MMTIDSTIHIPSIVSTTDMIYVSSGYGGTQDVQLDLGTDMYLFLMIKILREEMAEMRKNHPEVDYTKLQEMINSGDVEMRNLAYTLLDEYTIYSSRILGAVASGYPDRYQVQAIVRDYTQNNRTNIGEYIL